MNLTSIFKTNGINLIIKNKQFPDYIVIIPPSSDDQLLIEDEQIISQCISDLEPSTDYSITVVATFNCVNVSGSVDFRTLAAASSIDNPSTQDCIKYDPQRQINGNELLKNFDDCRGNSVEFHCTCQSTLKTTH